MFRSAFTISLGFAFVSAVGCGGGEDEDNDNDSADADGRSDSDGGDGDLNFGDGDGDLPGGDGDVIDGCSDFSTAGCTGITYEGENVPLDIYVMFDLSCSMSCTTEQSGCCMGGNDAAPEEDWRITPVREAMRLFLEDPQSAGIGVGLGFFGDHGVNDATDEGEGDYDSICTVAGHADATVEIAPLPDSAATLISTLDSNGPQGGTPTHFAIDGACEYSNNWKAEHPSHKVVVLLVTDGIPEHSCDADIEQAVEAAENCYDGGAGRETYVLGIEVNNGNSLEQLNDIAVGGGTEQAYLTDANDVAGSVLSALNAIRADAVIPCTISIPEPATGTIDYTRVNVGICDASEESVHTYQVQDPVDCDNGAWYYDQAGNEQVVQLCDATCETVSSAGSSLTLTVGCTTVTTPVK